MNRYSIAMGKKPKKLKGVSNNQLRGVIRSGGRIVFKVAKDLYNYMFQKGGWWNPVTADPPIMGYTHVETGEKVEIEIEDYQKTVKTVVEAKRPQIYE